MSLNVNRFEKHCILITLKEVMDQLIVISKGNYTVPVELYRKKPAKERFQGKIHESVYKKLDPFQMPFDAMEKVKLQKELSFTITIFSKTFEEIIKNGTFTFMRNAIKEHKIEEADERCLLEEYKKENYELERMKKQYSRKVTMAEIRLLVADENIAKLKNDLDNVQHMNDLEMSLVERWEQTRFDQAEILRKKEEKRITEEIKINNFKAEKEKRNIHDIENYLNLKIAEYKKQILYWQDRYHSEISDHQSEIKKISQEIFVLNKKYDKMLDIYNTRQAFINEYEERKEAERKEIEFQHKRINCAVLLQAWWRGVMVRKCLGPFKKKTKKSKKGKKGK